MDKKAIIIVHFTGCGYYYATNKGQKVSKEYSKLHNLKKYGKINWAIIY